MSGHPHRYLLFSTDPFGIAVLSGRSLQAGSLRGADDMLRIEACIDL